MVIMQIIETDNRYMTGTLPVAERQEQAARTTTAPRFSETTPVFSYLFWKYLVDRFAALGMLIVLSPLMGVIAIAIRLDSRGGALFHREQVGSRGKNFMALKFRTMYDGNDDQTYREYVEKYVRENAPYQVDENGARIFKVVNDSRVTRVGRFLRKTNLDELPQLVNVLKGEMSFIGPRPDVPFAVAMYRDWHLKRLNARPGITGLWQVCGRKAVPFEGMVRLDISYINRRSLALDLKIAFLTVATILKGDGS